MATMHTFLNRMLTVFLARVRPDSSIAKPRCIMKTRKVETSIQVLLTTKSTSSGDSEAAASSWANAGAAKSAGPRTARASGSRNLMRGTGS